MTITPTPKAIVAVFSAVLLYILGFLGVYPAITLPVSLLLVVLVIAEHSIVNRYESLLSLVSVRREPVERAAPENTPIRIVTRVCNKSRESMDNIVVLEDTPPRTRRVPSVAGFLVNVDPGKCITYTYELVGAPGLSTAKRVILEKPSPLALFSAVRDLESIIVVRYYPVTIAARTRMYSGEKLGLEEIYSRRIKGAGMEFYSIREYQLGDDPRRIVWSASARLQRLLVREDLAELRLRLYIFLDLSRPMWIGEPGASPGDNALRTASSLAMRVKQSAGILGYTFLYGEIWFSRPPTHASQSFFELYNRASMTDPYLTAPRTNFRDALREASAYSEYIPLVLFTGPEISLHVNDVADAARRRRASLILVYLYPEDYRETFLEEYRFVAKKLSNHPLVQVLRASSLTEALGAISMIAPRLMKYVV